MDKLGLGRRLSELEAEFSFGEIPEDDLPPCAADIDIMDAVNDETFGDMAPLNQELDYAAQTASLRLDDDGWGEQPGCSAAAPDPSQLPIPKFMDFGFGGSAFDAFRSADEDLLPNGGSLSKIDWNTSSNGVFNLWGNDAEPVTSSLSARDAANFDLPKSRPEVEIRRPAPPPMPVQAHTLEDLEKLYSTASTSERTDQSAESHAVPELPTMPTLSGAINAADLERSMVESHGARSEAKPELPSHHVGHAIPFPPMGMPPGPMPPFMPPIPPMFLPFMNGWWDFLSGKIPYLPPGFPPVPPPVFLMHRQMRSGALPGLAPMGHPQGQMGPPMNQGQSDWQRRPMHRRVAPGMPSGKTIEDFAFDPYAGFMSCKEREWLVRIQILQCQGQTGDSFEDDFYYASWRAKRLAAGWRPKECEKSDKHEDNRRTPLREKDRNRGEDRHREYKAPNFVGSLGKPVSSTVYNPRHLIDVSGEKEEPSKPSSQKKLRTMLLRLESAALLLMDCADKKRQSGNHLTDKLASEITERVELVIKELFTLEQIVKTVQLAKGRTILRKLLSVALPKQFIHIVVTLFNALSGFQKKTYHELSADLLPSVNVALSYFSREELIFVISSIDGPLIRESVLQKNSFARDLLVLLLLWSARRRATSSDSIFQWLRSREDVQWDGADWSHSIATFVSLINLGIQDVFGFAEWLRFLSADPKAVTVASRLASSISA